MRPRGHEPSATGVTVAYDGVDVLHDASMTLRPGRVTSPVGPNGSGGSTLLPTIARLQRPRTGAWSSNPACPGSSPPSRRAPSSS